LTLAGLCEPTDTTIGPDATLEQASDKFAETGTRYLYMVAPNGCLLGALSIHAVQRALREQPDADLFTLCERDFPTLTPESRLPDALSLFTHH
ncbi:CBS domain-containing protein, partial [Variovorax sp. 2RAF20]